MFKFNLQNHVILFLSNTRIFVILVLERNLIRLTHFSEPFNTIAIWDHEPSQELFSIFLHDKISIRWTLFSGSVFAGASRNKVTTSIIFTNWYIRVLFASIFWRKCRKYYHDDVTVKLALMRKISAFFFYRKRAKKNYRRWKYLL